MSSDKVASIEPLIQSKSASVLNMSPYFPDFNPIELWWSQRLGFLKYDIWSFQALGLTLIYSHRKRSQTAKHG
jgi:transposase